MFISSQQLGLSISGIFAVFPLFSMETNLKTFTIKLIGSLKG